MLFCDGFASVGAINSVFPGGSFLLLPGIPKVLLKIGFVNTRHTRQSKKINFIFLYPDKHSQQQQIDTVFSIECVRHTRSSLSCKFLVYEGYLNFCLWFFWLRQQIVMYLEQPHKCLFCQLGYNWVLSHIYFLSQFFGVGITFWVRLVNKFLKVRMKTSLFPELYSR